MLRRLVLSSACSALLFACPGPTPGTDGGTDAGEELPVEFDVAGTASVFPEAIAVLADAGLTETIVGLTVRVEEPLKVATFDPLGIFSTQTLDATGAFSASKVPAELVSLGVAAGIKDEADAGAPRVVRSATVLYDVALEAKKPTANITGAKAYAIPTLFHDVLTRSVGEATIRGLTGANDKGTLIEAGFILGKVVDAQGAPVSGVTVVPSVASKAGNLFYPTADYASTGAATSASGLFLYVHNGGSVDTFRFTIAGRTEYKTRNAGASKDACLVVTVYPGNTPP